MSTTSPQKDPSPKQKPDEIHKEGIYTISMFPDMEATQRDFGKKSDHMEKWFNSSPESPEKCLIL